jgi:hypothetical protein
VEPLPQGFDGIALGKKERDKVRTQDRNPFRKESDIVGAELCGPESPEKSSNPS